jgi:para-nitrobenzyl esterase
MTMGQQRDTFAGPMIDGKVVVEEPETAFRAGRQARIPYLVGANNREFGFMPLAPQAVSGMLARFGAARDEVVAAYDPEKTGDMGEVGIGLMSDGAMVEPARPLARLASAAGQPTFVYRFSYVASSIRRDAKGALRVLREGGRDPGLRGHGGGGEGRPVEGPARPRREPRLGAALPLEAAVPGARRP